MKFIVLIALQLALAGLPAAPAAAQPATASAQHVVLAGGCFWGMQMVFEKLKGVTNVVAGYSGGSASTAHYEVVSTGMTGHAESVDVTYDPSKISYNQQLQVYFTVAADPTELNYQGPDHGTQYRSAVFYTTSAQRDQTQKMIHQLQARHAFDKPIVTQVVPLKAFYAAEAYHQDYGVHSPANPYIVINDDPKVAHLHRAFPKLFR